VCVCVCGGGGGGGGVFEGAFDVLCAACREELKACIAPLPTRR
jgi:hypothetical protein